MTRAGQCICACALTAGFFAVAGGTGPDSPPPAPPATPRAVYNAGTQKLLEGKLREAEPLLESALASQQASLQPPVLYNLGHVRFAQGLEDLHKTPPAAATLAAGQTTARQADEALHSAARALAGDDVQAMVEAYLRGHGRRREVKTALEAVRAALASHRATLGKWQRAAGDFRSAVELNRTQADAQFNADVVDRWIARLVDTLRELQQLANALGDQQRELADKLKQLKGRIPAQDLPPGAAGDQDDEEDDRPMGPRPGQIEGPGREGEQLTLSPEQAGWLLEGFRLDVERRLPMNQTQPAEPRDRNRPTW
jgi:tetratricopeptide (TPR) repeat protein